MIVRVSHIRYRLNLFKQQDEAPGPAETAVQIRIEKRPASRDGSFCAFCCKQDLSQFPDSAFSSRIMSRS